MYSIVFNNREIDLPNYSFSIAEKLEAIETSNNQDGKKFKDKCRMMYSFEKDMLGEEVVDEIIGDFETCDPNDISLLYRAIVICYNQPIMEQQTEQIRALTENKDFGKLFEMYNSINSASNRGRSK